METYGRAATLQAAALRAYGFATSPLSYRGIQSFSWALGRLFGRDAYAVAALGEEGKMRIHLSDGYWTRLLLGASYEPEVAGVLARALRPGTPFLDCGANVGYWTIIAAARHSARCVAVEAAKRTYDELVENVQLNQIDATTVHAALWHTAGESLSLVSHPRRHAGSSVVNRRNRIGEGDYMVEAVETVTIDALADALFAEQYAVVKLDVEGAEVQALRGGEALFRRDSLLIYEDHEQDEYCETTRAVIDLLDYRPLAITEEGLLPLKSLDAVIEAKRGRGGANFCATVHSSSRWAEIVG